LTSEDNWDPNETTSDEISAIILYSDNLYHRLISNVNISAILHTKYHKEITKESLAELWSIGIDVAQRTIDTSTQNTLRVTNCDLHHRFQTKAHQWQFNQLGGIYGRYCTDTAIAKIKSIRGNTCAQIFTNAANHTVCYPMKSKGEAHLALSNFFHDIVVPNTLHSDNAKEFTAGEFRNKCNKHSVKQTFIEPKSQWKNPVEKAIGLVKRIAVRIMHKMNTPICLRDYAYEYSAQIRSLTVTKQFLLKDRTPFEHVKDYTPDISEFTTFKWYEWCWYYEEDNM